MPPIGFDRLTEIPEDALVEAVFADPLLSRGIGAPPSIQSAYYSRFRVKFSDLGLPAELRGDADALLIAYGRPDIATAVEFKRVKITADSFRTDQINKLPELKKAVRQANTLHRAGFAYCWLSVLIVADVRFLTHGVSFAGPPLRFIEQVRSAIPENSLAPGVGLQLCVISQVSDAPADERGGAGWKLVRLATAQAQPEALTARIYSLFAEPVAT